MPLIYIQNMSAYLDNFNVIKERYLLSCKNVRKNKINKLCLKSVGTKVRDTTTYTQCVQYLN